MPNADFFRRFGLYIRRDFFEPDLCRRLHREMRSSDGVMTTVGDRAGRYVVDPSIRNAREVTVADSTCLLIRQRFSAEKAALEAHFKVALNDFQAPQLVRYREGEYYRRHADHRSDEQGHEVSKRRRISAVAFLNRVSELPEDGCYGGGALTFYELLKHPVMADRGIPLDGESGMIVAFQSELLHEVRTVSHGERYTAVTWYG